MLSKIMLGNNILMERTSIDIIFLHLHFFLREKRTLVPFVFIDNFKNVYLLWLIELIVHKKHVILACTCGVFC